MPQICGGGGAQRPVWVLVSLKRRVRAQRNVRPKPTSTYIVLSQAKMVYLMETYVKCTFDTDGRHKYLKAALF